MCVCVCVRAHCHRCVRVCVCVRAYCRGQQLLMHAWKRKPLQHSAARGKKGAGQEGWGRWDHEVGTSVLVRVEIQLLLRLCMSTSNIHHSH